MISSENEKPFDTLAVQHDGMVWNGTPSDFDREVDKRLQLYSMKGSTKKVLALGGGSGHELLPFVRSGCECLLVDNSMGMLTLAKEHFGTRIKYIYEDACEFVTNSKTRYDVILQIGELTSYIENPISLCMRCAGILEADGILLLTIMDAEELAKRIPKSTRSPFDGGFYFLERREPELVAKAFYFENFIYHLKRAYTVVETVRGMCPRALIIAKNRAFKRNE